MKRAVGGPDPESCDEFRPERAPHGLLVMIQAGKLTRISLVELSDIKTDKGFGIGDAAAAIKAACAPNPMWKTKPPAASSTKSTAPEKPAPSMPAAQASSTSKGAPDPGTPHPRPAARRTAARSLVLLS